MKKYVASFIVLLATFAGGGALLDHGGHAGLAWTMIAMSVALLAANGLILFLLLCARAVAYMEKH